MITKPHGLLSLLVFAGLVAKMPAASATVSPPDQLYGEWQLVLKVRDKNRNGQLDADERDPQRNVVFTERDAKDYLRFNRDGTCAFYMHKVQGRFELRPQRSGTTTLHLFDRDNNREGRGVLHMVNDRELILFTSEVFSVFKRLATDAAAPPVPTAAASGPLMEACSLIPKADLERLLGWELRDGQPQVTASGQSQCEFTPPPRAEVTRRFSNPFLPEAAGLSSVVITTLPYARDEMFRSNEPVAGGRYWNPPSIGAHASLLEITNGTALIRVRVGARGVNIRLQVEEPKTTAGSNRLYEVMVTLAKAGVIKLRQ